MKKAFPLLLLFIAAIATAGTYSITTNTTQDNRLEKQRVRLNTAACTGVGLVSTCTQAQCRNLNPNCNIYTDISDLLDREVIKNYTDGLKVNDTRDDQTQFCAWWNNAGTTLAAKNSVCTTSGLPAGCVLCQ